MSPPAFYRPSKLTPAQRDEIRQRWEEECQSDNPPTKQDFARRMAAKYNASANGLRAML